MDCAAGSIFPTRESISEAVRECVISRAVMWRSEEGMSQRSGEDFVRRLERRGDRAGNKKRHHPSLSAKLLPRRKKQIVERKGNDMNSLGAASFNLLCTSPINSRTTCVGRAQKTKQCRGSSYPGKASGSSNFARIASGVTPVKSGERSFARCWALRLVRWRE
jgi:hypothetical protein